MSECSGHITQPPCGRTSAVPGTARPRRSFEPSSCAGPVPPIPEPGFIALHSAWSLRSYLELGALPTAVPCTRRHTHLLLREWGLTEHADLTEVTELLVSELMTNAYETTTRHDLGTSIRYRLSSNHRAVLLEVWDADATPPPAATALPSPDALGGRGLFLVDTLSARWGWYSLRHWGGKVIWAEVAP